MEYVQNFQIQVVANRVSLLPFACPADHIVQTFFDLQGLIWLCQQSFFSMAASAQQKQSLSITLENVEYPYPLNFISMSIEGQDVRMAYMDIKPANYN